MNIDFKLLGDNIRRRRSRLHMTQQQLADAAFLSTSLISKLERGVKTVSLDTLGLISESLGTTASALLSDPNEPDTAYSLAITEILEVLATLTPSHLRMIHAIVTAYAAQLYDTQPAPEDTDRSNT